MMSTLAASGRGRERLVLAAGLGSALALAWVAFAATGSTDAAGEVAVARLAGDVAGGVAEEWGRMRRDAGGPPGPWVPLGERFEWTSADTGPRAPVAARDLRALAAAEPAPVFGALLREAERLDRAGESAEALATVLEALAALAPAALAPEVDLATRAEGRLRAIQIAVRAGAGEVVREQWGRAREELGPRDARGDTAYLLLCALAAAPVLDDGERAAAQLLLVQYWSRDELALPTELGRLIRDEAPRAYRVAPAPTVAALRERLVALLPAAPIARSLARDTRRRRIRALARALDGLPDLATDGEWYLARHPVGWFAARRTAGTRTGFFVDPRAIEAALARRAALPAGFTLDFEGDAAEEGELVRPRTALAGADLGFVLRHSDPSALARDARDRLLLVRAGLGVLALFSALASLATFRALARERRLAQLKSDFIAGVSHDLRTPLASILLMAENLEHGRVQGADARARYFASIRREADRLRRLVDDVLDFSRIERGAAPRLQAQDVALGPFLDELEAELGERVTGAGVQFRFERGELPPSAMLDAEAVRRAAWNLVDNALKHSGAEHVGIRVALRGERELTIAVEDDGCGVPAAKREAIFRPFARLAESNGSTAGTGLGLAIVREVARAHGGSVVVRTGAEGQGSVFELALDLEVGSSGAGAGHEAHG